MGLAGEIIRRGVVSAFKAAELGHEVFGHYPPAPPSSDVRRSVMTEHRTEDLVDEGADDVWPEEAVVTGEGLEAFDDPMTVVSEQWGVELPNGTVHWNMWQGIHLNNPLDRTKLVAVLQEAALSCGYSSEQYPEFLSRYRWVTRVQRVVYEDTGAYPLTDIHVALRIPSRESSDDNESGSVAPTLDSDPTIRSGSVGDDEK